MDPAQDVNAPQAAGQITGDAKKIQHEGLSIGSCKKEESSTKNAICCNIAINCCTSTYQRCCSTMQPNDGETRSHQKKDCCLKGSCEEACKEECSCSSKATKFCNITVNCCNATSKQVCCPETQPNDEPRSAQKKECCTTGSCGGTCSCTSKAMECCNITINCCNATSKHVCCPETQPNDEPISVQNMECCTTGSCGGTSQDGCSCTSKAMESCNITINCCNAPNKDCCSTIGSSDELSTVKKDCCLNGSCGGACKDDCSGSSKATKFCNIAVNCCNATSKQVCCPETQPNDEPSSVQKKECCTTGSCGGRSQEGCSCTSKAMKCCNITINCCSTIGSSDELSTVKKDCCLKGSCGEACKEECSGSSKATKFCNIAVNCCNATSKQVCCPGTQPNDEPSSVQKECCTTGSCGGTSQEGCSCTSKAMESCNITINCCNAPNKVCCSTTGSSDELSTVKKDCCLIGSCGEACKEECSGSSKATKFCNIAVNCCNATSKQVCCPETQPNDEPSSVQKKASKAMKCCNITINCCSTIGSSDELNTVQKDCCLKGSCGVACQEGCNCSSRFSK